MTTSSAPAQNPLSPSAGKKLERPDPASAAWGELIRFLSDPLTYLPRLAAEHGGDLVPFQLGRLPCTLVTKPELIEQGLLNENWPPISRGRLVNLKNWYKGGLFVNIGQEHHRQRDDIWMPVLKDPVIPQITSQVAQEWIGNWRDGTTYDIFADLRALCFTIDWKALTGEDLRKDPDLLDALVTGVNTLPWLILPLGLTRWGLPLPGTVKAKRAQKLINDRVTQLIAERRRDKTKTDLLAKMVAVRDQAGSETTDAQLNSTMMMYFGADQLHALFAWTFYLLAQNPEVEAKLHAEVDRELSGPPTQTDAGKLKYLRNVLMESMRLMPPVWGFFRELTADYQLGDTVLPAGSLMGFSPWVTHRDPRYWPDPLKFDPDRWQPGVKRPPSISYFPMSAGPYRCHGTELAMIQAFLIFTDIVRRWKLTPARSGPVKPIATWCTEPKGGMRMTVHARKK